MIDKEIAIDERKERAREVRTTYYIEQCGPVTWFVQHPTEDDRAYVVDTAKHECDCPDFTCRANVDGYWCKHLYAVANTNEPHIEALPFRKNGKPTADAGFVACIEPDPSDPYRD